MGTSGGFAAMGAMSLVSSAQRASGQQNMANYQSAMYGINKQMAGEQGKMATAQGDIQAGQMELQGRQEAAKQRVASAATGASVNSGSALDLQVDTKWQAGQNAIMIKNNAWRQAWGYQVEGMNYDQQASMTNLAANQSAQMSYLTGGMQAVGYGIQGGAAYSKYNGGGGGSSYYGSLGGDVGAGIGS